MINFSQRLRTARLEFSYTFEFGIISGSVEGDYFTRKPNAVFNLKHLNAQYLEYATHKILTFDQVYGQCSLDSTGALFSGSSVQSSAMFSLSYRSQEAVVFDGHNWLENPWNPTRWSIERVRQSSLATTAKVSQERPRLLMPRLSVQSA